MSGDALQTTGKAPRPKRARSWRARTVGGVSVASLVPLPRAHLLARDWAVDLSGVSDARRQRWASMFAIALAALRIYETAPHGKCRRFVARLLTILPPELFPRRPAKSTLYRWLQRLDAGGPAELLDRRGRPRRRRGVDFGLLAEFRRRVKAGERAAVVHRELFARAAREGRRWPRRKETARRWLPPA